MDRYTTLAARQMHEDGRRASWADVALHPPVAFLRNYVLRRGFTLRRAGPGHLADERRLRGPEVRQALGTVFSLHIDTARTWRGGQHQVFLTLLGLRERGHRAVLVAHPEGVLYQRAREGADLVPLAPRNEIDLSAAWKLSRVIEQYRPEIVHAHDPHAVSMAALALSFGSAQPSPRLVASRRVDFHLQKHSFSRWKYRQVDTFIAASDAIRQILIGDGIPAGADRRWCTTASTSSGCRRRRRRTSARSSGCRTARR